MGIGFDPEPLWTGFFYISIPNSMSTQTLYAFGWDRDVGYTTISAQLASIRQLFSECFSYTSVLANNIYCLCGW